MGYLGMSFVAGFGGVLASCAAVLLGYWFRPNMFGYETTFGLLGLGALMLAVAGISWVRAAALAERCRSRRGFAVSTALIAGGIAFANSPLLAPLPPEAALAALLILWPPAEAYWLEAKGRAQLAWMLATALGLLAFVLAMDTLYEVLRRWIWYVAGCFLLGPTLAVFQLRALWYVSRTAPFRGAGLPKEVLAPFE